MDTSTSTNTPNAISIGKYLTGSLQIGPDQINQVTQADWEEVLNDLYDELRPRVKYMPVTEVVGLLDFAKWGNHFHISQEQLGAITREFRKMGADSRVFTLCRIWDKDGFPNKLRLDLLAGATNGQLFRIKAGYEEELEKKHLLKNLEVTPVSFKDLPLTSGHPHLAGIIPLGGYLLWRLNEISVSITKDRDEKTQPFRRVAQKSAAMMRKFTVLSILVKDP